MAEGGEGRGARLSGGSSLDEVRGMEYSGVELPCLWFSDMWEMARTGTYGFMKTSSEVKRIPFL